MSDEKPGTLTRRDFLSVSVGVAVVAGVGCSTDSSSPANGTQSGSGGGSLANVGAQGTKTGLTATGGSSTSGGSSSVGTTPPSNGGNTGSTATSATGNGGQDGSGQGGANNPTSTGPAGGSSNNGSKTGGDRQGAGAPNNPGGTNAKPGGANSGGRASGTVPAAGRPNSGGGNAAGRASGGTPAAGRSGSSIEITGGNATTAGGSGSGEKPLVCLARNTDIGKAVKDAIAAVGGFPDLTGKVVVIRPNSIPTDGPPYNTNPDVIRAIIQVVKASGTPKSITVCDDAYQGDLMTSMKANGLAAAATAEGATAVDMKGSGTTTVNPTGATNWTSGITFYNMMLDADYVINAPVCKSHAYAGFTMAMKAWYGNQTNYRNTHPTNLSPALAELHLAKREDFVVLDATKTLLTGGPFKGDGDAVASPGIVVAATDAIAADVTGLCIMKHYIKQTGVSNNQITNQKVWKQGVIARAQQLTQLGWITGTTFPYQAIGIDEAATIMGYREA